MRDQTPDRPRNAHRFAASHLEAWRTAQPKQLALFELKNDRRPEAERTAAERYLEPTLFTFGGDDLRVPSKAHIIPEACSPTRRFA
jgi:hypothetical protein